MKKLLFSLLALMAILPASADRYLTFGVNDTLRINPSYIGGIQGVMVRAHFDGRLDHWDMTLQLPQDMRLTNVYMRNDMLNIPYINYLGEASTCSAQLFFSEYNYTRTDSLTASIIVPGYWLYNGNYDCYGNVKWEAGDYDQMCELYFHYENTFPDTASLYIKEHLMSTWDQRGFTIPDTYINYWRIFLYVGYLRGDIDGNDVINLSDLTLLIDYLMVPEGLDYYQLKAADVDGDGMVTISDISELTDMIILAGYNVFDDPTI